HGRVYPNTAGQTGVTIAYPLRDIDGSTDNAISPVAMHFRVGASGTFTNVPAAFVADPTTRPRQATQAPTGRPVPGRPGRVRGGRPPRPQPGHAGHERLRRGPGRREHPAARAGPHHDDR